LDAAEHPTPIEKKKQNPNTIGASTSKSLAKKLNATPMQVEKNVAMIATLPKTIAKVQSRIVNFLLGLVSRSDSVGG